MHARNKGNQVFYLKHNQVSLMQSVGNAAVERELLFIGILRDNKLFSTCYNSDRKSLIAIALIGRDIPN